MLSAETGDILALCVLAALGLSPSIWVILMMRRSPISPIQCILYAINYILTRIIWRTEIRGRLPALPPGRGAVIVCNHRCPLDPSFIALTGPRVIYWLVAREYCEYPPFRALLRICGAIPVTRGGTDPGAMRTVVRLLEQGELVGFFPEGHINTTARTMLPGRRGAALAALKGRSAVVPCYINGAPFDGTTLGCMIMPARVTLVIGEPIDISPYFGGENDRAVLDEVTRLFLNAIARLAGDETFQPELAGRQAKDTSP